MARVGRETKAAPDYARVIIDATGWLDPGETITAISTPVVAPSSASWSAAMPLLPLPGVDATPLTVSSIAIAPIGGISAAGVMAFVQSGTPGNVYDVTFLVTGSSSRIETVIFTIAISGTPPAPSGTPPVLANGGVSRLGDTMLGPLYLYGPPVGATEAADKSYVDSAFATASTAISAEAATRAANDTNVAAVASAALTAAITSEAATRAAADITLAASVTTLATSTGTALTAAIAADAAAWAAAISTAIAAEVTARTAAIAADAAAWAAAVVDAGWIVGEAKFFLGPASLVPGKWQLAYGQALSRTGYAAAFAVFGVTYGIGDGITTFNAPDMRGRVPVGMDTMAALAAGRMTVGVSGVDGTTLGAAGGSQYLFAHAHGTVESPHTHGTVEAPHAHGINEWTDGGGGGGTGEVTSDAGAGTTAGVTNGAVTGLSLTAAATGLTVSAAGAGGAQNVQPSLVGNWMVYLGA